MGDVSTHADIAQHIVTEARAGIPDSVIPERDYVFLELGNFLTDVSQFRDPPAFHRARDLARAEAQRQSSLAGLAGADAWVRDVFGRHSGPVHGALPEMLRLFMYAFVHELVDDDGLPVLGSALGLLAPGVRPALIPTHGIPPAAVDVVLARSFTQYFPHEHLDFPPTVDLVHHRTLSIFKRESRGLIAYLEWMLQYVSEELSRLEQEWVSLGSTIRPPQRQAFLVRLGHLLHPIEDYFFHSNLAELYQWADVRSAHPTLDPNIPADLQVLVNDDLRGTRLNTLSVPLRRKLHRRLRYPIFDTNDRLSSTLSDDGTALVFTGGFGQNDVWHTLGGALEAIESKIAILPPTHDPRMTPLVLIRLLLSQTAREAMVSGHTVDAMRTTHLTQLRAGDYTTAVASWVSSGLLCPHAGDQLRAAFDLDLTISNRHSGRFVTFPGPGAVLITMMDQMQRERDASAAAVSRLDGTTASMYDRGSTNGASAEAVGTHSLMSKDSRDKDPGRAEAVAFAKHASASVATLLLNRVTGTRPVTEGLDWDTLLRFFVRGPVSAGGFWETELLAGVHGGTTFSQPHVAALHQQPNFAMLSPTFGAAKLAARRSGTTKADLEAYYRRFESDPP